jgi:hypothetical protein
MRALLRAVHRWATTGDAPPPSRYPKLADGTLVRVDQVRFPAVPGVGDPRTIEGPGQMLNGRFAALPFLVPQVDADGNELAGIRVPDLAVPLGTATGWNFRSARVGNPSTIYPLVGSYVPFARTRAERDAKKDPRPSAAERYRDRADYMLRIQSATLALMKDGFLLDADLDGVMNRAWRHWELVTEE